MEQVDKKTIVSSCDETKGPCVGHLSGARIAGNWKLRSKVQREVEAAVLDLEVTRALSNSGGHWNG